MDFKSLNINADRICEAISKIGYKPHAAIMDIIDNSIAAKSTEVTVKFYIDSSKNLNNKKNITKIEIADNGIGMSDEQIDTALELGSDVQYDDHSLSKYGLGLKSAGFSLGRRIEVASKPNGVCSSLKFIDREIIKAQNSYGVCTAELGEYYTEILKSLSTGTIIGISDISYTSNVSASKIISNLCDRIGVIYYHYLQDESLKINIQAIKDDEIIAEKEPAAIDILFWDDAYETFEKESYDCKKPCKVFDEEFENPLDSDGEKIRLQVSIFPQDGMKIYREFTDEEQKAIKSYMINTHNHGFFFFRNGRLIKWGDKIQGLVGRSDLGFRVKINFTTAHDELFDVDVSKQELSVPEDILSVLARLCKLPLSQSKEIFKICYAKLVESKQKEKEGEAYNDRNENLEEDDIEDAIDVEEKKQRQMAIQKESEEIIDEVNAAAEEEATEGAPEGEATPIETKFQRIRYISDFDGVHLWEPCYDTNRGNYVLINKSHPFYSQTLNKLAPSTPERQAIEAIFHALAAGHNQTMMNMPDAELEVIQKIFKQFLTSSSHALSNWVNINWDLYDNEN